MDTQFGPLQVTTSSGVATVVIDHPPSNLVDGPFLAGLRALLDELESDEGVRAAVFMSADPDFYLMHGDVERILRAGTGTQPAATARPPAQPNPAAALFERVHTSRIFTVAALDGAARGGGAELAASLDVRIGTTRTVVGQPEVAMGIVPGATGTSRLPRLLGRSRALELLLTCRDLTADEALAIGWLDHVVEPGALADEARRLAERVAQMPAAAIGAAKRVVDASLGPMGPALAAESAELAALLAAGSHVGPMRRFLDAGGQSRAAEAAGFATLVDAMLGG